MPFSLAIRVVASDIDELGHASNIVYLRWAQEVAIAHSTAVGLGPAEYRALGQVFLVRRHGIDYLRPALLGDALLVETRVTALGSASSRRLTIIRRAEDGVVLARVVTDWAYVDMARGRPVRIPEEVRRRVIVEPAPADDAT